MRTVFLLSATLVIAVATVACQSNDAKKDPASDPAKDPAAATPPAPTKKKVDAAATGGVEGTVSFAGALPAPTMIRASSDAACAKAHPGEFDSGDVKVKDGKVEDAFVWVKNGLDEYGFDAPKEPAKVDQRGCMYAPRIIGVRPDQEIEFLNSDPTLHNISSKPQSQKGWNFVTPQGQSGKRSFKKPEVPIRIGCDVHPWMRAYIGVVDHPFFAVTGADGKFSFSGLPAGTFTIAAWHERLGTIEQEVTIAAGEKKTAALALPGGTAAP